MSALALTARGRAAVRAALVVQCRPVRRSSSLRRHGLTSFCSLALTARGRAAVQAALVKKTALCGLH